MISRLYYIPLLRLFGSVAVVLHHAEATSAKWLATSSAMSWVFAVFHGSAVFMIITPFLIVYTVENGKYDYLSYAVRRFIRIVPIYWLITLLSFVVLALFARGNPGDMTVGKLIASLVFVADPIYGRPVMYTGWTMEYIVLVYVISVLAILYGQKVWIQAVSVFCAVQGLGLFVAEGQSSPALAYLANPILYNLSIGLVLAVGIVRGIWHPVALAALAVGAVFLLGRYVLHGESLAALTTSLAVSAGVALAHRLNPMFARGGPLLRFLSAIGESSYSIYLVQVLTISGFIRLLSVLGVYRDPDLYGVLVTLATVAVGWLCYWGLERRFLDLSQKLGGVVRSRHPSPA